MTAIVGILNKHGIAIAADSAETIGNGLKIYNKANKIFNLSKYHPIGAAVYGNANFGDLVPWDIVFKLYRKSLCKTCFDKVEDYVYDFVSFIEKNSFFSDVKEFQERFNNNVFEYFEKYILLNRIGHNTPNVDFSLLPNTILLINKELDSAEDIESLKELSKTEFEVYIQNAINRIKSVLKANGYLSVENDLKEVLYKSFTKKEIMHAYSGISIFGYGDKEIYPRLFKIKIYGVVCGKLKWYIEEACKINNKNTGIICPMAQSDVMVTLLSGIEPKLQQLIVQLTSQVIKENIKQMASIVGTTNKTLAKDILAIDIQPTLNLFNTKLNGMIQNNHVAPLINTIAILQKEDLAEVAENLVYLTSLIRRITPDQESVGGPIDVALLSKGDGFIWIKRKHYFEETLNKNYFGKYYIDADSGKEANNE